MQLGNEPFNGIRNILGNVGHTRSLLPLATRSLSERALTRPAQRRQAPGAHQDWKPGWGVGQPGCRVLFRAGAARWCLVLVS